MKKKKQFKAPVDKDRTGSPKASRSKRAAKKKKSSALSLIIGLVLVVLAVVVFVVFKGKKNDIPEAKVVTETKEASKKNVSQDTNKDRKNSKVALNREIKTEAKKGNVRELIKARIERDNPGVTVNLDRIKVSEGELSVNLDKLDIRNIAALKDFPVNVLRLSQNPIDDYSPLKGMELKHLELFNSTTTVPLRYINFKAVRHLHLGMSSLDDLRELSKYRGYYLSIKQYPAILSLLRDAPLFRIDIDSVSKPLKVSLLPDSVEDLRLYKAEGIKSIHGLKHLKLKGFYLIGSPCNSIQVLKGMPLEYISLVGTAVEDLSPLAGAPIKELSMPYHCRDLTVLRTLSSLKKLAIPRPLWKRELEQFRGKNIIIEGFDRKSSSWWLEWGIIQETSSEKFWKRFDENKRRGQ